MIGRVIALVGISGVGKSYLARKLSTQLQCQHLCASDVIQSQRKLENARESAPDILRPQDIKSNQWLLETGFERLRDPHTHLVLLDGHTLIDTPGGTVEVGTEVFRSLGVHKFVFLADDPATIAARRAADLTRTRVARSIEELAAYQEAALLSCFRIALSLNLDVSLIVPPHDFPTLLASLQQ